MPATMSGVLEEPPGALRDHGQSEVSAMRTNWSDSPQLVVDARRACPAAAGRRRRTRSTSRLMADLRILQEQSQLLQNMLGTLADAIKAVNTRLEQQAEAEPAQRSADAKLLDRDA